MELTLAPPVKWDGTPARFIAPEEQTGPDPQRPVGCQEPRISRNSQEPPAAAGGRWKYVDGTRHNQFEEKFDETQR
jgi:hypothetical protein